MFNSLASFVKALKPFLVAFLDNPLPIISDLLNKGKTTIITSPELVFSLLMVASLLTSEKKKQKICLRLLENLEKTNYQSRDLTTILSKFSFPEIPLLFDSALPDFLDTATVPPMPYLQIVRCQPASLPSVILALLSAKVPMHDADGFMSFPLSRMTKALTHDLISAHLLHISKVAAHHLNLFSVIGVRTTDYLPVLYHPQDLYSLLPVTDFLPIPASKSEFSLEKLLLILKILDKGIILQEQDEPEAVIDKTGEISPPEQITPSRALQQQQQAKKKQPPTRQDNRDDSNEKGSFDYKAFLYKKYNLRTLPQYKQLTTKLMAENEMLPPCLKAVYDRKRSNKPGEPPHLKHMDRLYVLSILQHVAETPEKLTELGVGFIAKKYDESKRKKIEDQAASLYRKPITYKCTTLKKKKFCPLVSDIEDLEHGCKGCSSPIVALSKRIEKKLSCIPLV